MFLLCDVSVLAVIYLAHIIICGYLLLLLFGFFAWRVAVAEKHFGPAVQQRLCWKSAGPRVRMACVRAGLVRPESDFEIQLAQRNWLMHGANAIWLPRLEQMMNFIRIAVKVIIHIWERGVTTTRRFSGQALQLLYVFDTLSRRNAPSFGRGHRLCLGVLSGIVIISAKVLVMNLFHADFVKHS